MLRLLSQHTAPFSVDGIPNSKLAITRLLFQLLAFGFLIGGSLAAAQTPPTLLNVYEDPFGVWIRYSHCASSEYQNCDINFGLYRSTSPGSNFSPIKTCLASSGNSTSDICQDETAKASQTYTYRLCTGGAALNDLSNCATSNPFTVPKATPPPQAPSVMLTTGASSITKGQSTSLTWNSANATSLDLQPGIGKVAPTGSTQVTPLQTTTYTLTATGNGYTEKATATITVPCFTQWAAPANLSAISGLSDAPLKWTNPVTDPYGTCPAPSTQVLIYRSGTNGLQQIASLAKTGNPGTLPGKYTDSSLLLPHSPYEYAVCEGGPPDWQNPTNCAFLPGAQHSIVTWGADPVLSATRDGANSIRLKLALDQYTVTSIVVTRQGSDDPCRQGGTLSNGLQGCKTVGPNGGSPAQTVTVYNWTQSSSSQLPPGFQNSQSAPFVIDLPDDTTVKPGVEYYYLAQVTWLSTIAQQSNTVTVPNAYSSATLQQGFAGGIKIKPIGNAPPPPPTQTSAPPTARLSPTSSLVTSAPPTMIGAARPTAPATAPPLPAAISPTRTPAPIITTANPMLHGSNGLTSSPLLAHPGTIATPPQPSPITNNLTAIIKQVQQKPHDAQALYNLGKAYCASSSKSTGVSYMYMALLLAEQSGSAPLVGQIKTSLTEQGVNAQ